MGSSALPGVPAGRRAATLAAESAPLGKAGDSDLFTAEELDEIERANEAGLTLSQIIDIFAGRGIRLSEATFRKYVQLGLLGRSRRVGRKGKHQGSLGLYPATTVRRLLAIKRMMAAHYTIEDIQRSFLRFAEEIEALRRDLLGLFAGLEQELELGNFPADRKRALEKELAAVRQAGDELVQRVESLERQVVSPLERAARARAVSTGSTGGAEDLL